MSLVSQAIKNIKGGVSQQPDILRYEDQGAEQVNAFSSEISGLIKRPPTLAMTRVGKTGLYKKSPLCHVIDRDSSERYVISFDGFEAHALDLLTGETKTINFPNGRGYLNTSNPRDDLKCVTVADYTFVINKAKACEAGTKKTPEYYDPERNALIVCSGGQYSRTFQVLINGTEVCTYTTPDGSNTGDGAKCDIQYIVKTLSATFNSFAQDTANNFVGWTSRAMEGYFWIRAPEGAKIEELRIVDGYNGKLLTGFRNDIQRTSELPVYAPPNYQVRVSGEAGTDQDDYWLRFDAERNVWVEMAAPNILSDFNKTTMPHALIREADGTFTFKPMDWTARAAGDDETNPYPSFIGQTLTDVFFYRNRLGFLSGENVILSESGAYFNFFPPSVAVSADSDPIDVAVSANRVSLLKYAIPFAEELLLWADNNQFVLGADGTLSPTSVKLSLTTEFEVSDVARPYGIDRGVYFVSERSTYSNINRYYAVQDVSSVKNAEDISAHVPSYIPNGVFSMSGSTTENFLSVLTTGNEKRVYVYKFLYLQEQLVQQSWSYWEFDYATRILMATVIGSTMYLLIDSPSGLYLERILFTQNTKDFQQEPYRLYMDRKTPYTIPAGLYDPDTGETTMKLKDVFIETPKDGRYYAVRLDGAMFRFDAPSNGWGPTDGTIKFGGDMTGESLVFGAAYEMKYVFSKFLIKKSGPDGSTATEDTGRLQLRRGWVNYEGSGNFKLAIDNQGRHSEYLMTGKRLGTQGMTLGQDNLDTGQFRYPLGGNAKNLTVTLTSDTPNPVAIIGGGWEGNYVRRSSGI